MEEAQIKCGSHSVGIRAFTILFGLIFINQQLEYRCSSLAQQRLKYSKQLALSKKVDERENDKLNFIQCFMVYIEFFIFLWTNFNIPSIGIISTNYCEVNV